MIIIYNNIDRIEAARARRQGDLRVLACTDFLVYLYIKIFFNSFTLRVSISFVQNKDEKRYICVNYNKTSKT